MNNLSVGASSGSTRKHWALVADSGRARVLEIWRSPYEIRLVREFHSKAEHTTSKELASDGSGRAYNVQGPSTHSKEQRSDPHEQAEQAFCKALVDYLEQALQQNLLENLVVIADPKTLGRLRRAMGRSLQTRVTEELNLDLTGLDLNELAPRLKSVLGWKY
ncbi:MAG: host attachment protein [Xanthomonadales bacterium]|nr:host attachment protein [Xanthomonadales bacterium]